MKEQSQADTLRLLIAEFERYLADDKQWSRRRFDEFSERFKSFGIYDRVTDEILRKARGMVPGGYV